MLGVLPPAHSPICLCHLWTGSASPAPPVYSKHRIYQTAHQNKRKEQQTKKLICLFAFSHPPTLIFKIQYKPTVFFSHQSHFHCFVLFFNPEKKRFSPGFLDQPPLLPRHSATLPRSVMDPFSGVPGMWFFFWGGGGCRQTANKATTLGAGRNRVAQLWSPPHTPSPAGAMHGVVLLKGRAVLKGQKCPRRAGVFS